MSELKPGMLAIIVKAHCEQNTHALGRIVTVKRVFTANLGRCAACGARNIPLTVVADVEMQNGKAGFIPSSYLKPIDPSALKEEQRNKEECPA